MRKVSLTKPFSRDQETSRKDIEPLIQRLLALCRTCRGPVSCIPVMESFFGLSLSQQGVQLSVVENERKSPRKVLLSKILRPKPHASRVTNQQHFPSLFTVSQTRSTLPFVAASTA